ncbi:hypothetical protein ABS71_06235 [bacterium SCN 62-11]|nr:hypothetical protein [Candidatus Eremiobacteraeota bacterium]ODT73983.1 MAG: hypothetical protein ABS71_06235 [bacterium SCN 62-11]
MIFKMLVMAALLVAPVAAEEGPAPWMLHPLRPPSRLAIRNLSIKVDYRQRVTPGNVAMESRAELSNEDDMACDEQFMLLNGDAASHVTWNGKELQQERLVMQIPDSPGQEMTRVSIFHLILLPREKGELKFSGLHKLNFRSETSHHLRLIFPLRRAWHHVGESDVQVALAPELKLLSRDFQPVTGQAATYQRHFGAYSKAIELSVEAAAGGPPWAGAVGAIPALRHTWMLGGLAALVAVTLAGISRRHWWLAIPLSLALNWGFRQRDEVVRQWTYYEDAREYKRALDLEWYLVPLWAFLGSMGVAVLGHTKEKK